MHPLLRHPQWTGSDRHVTVSAMEISDYAWKEDAGTLEMDVHPVAGFPLEMHFHIPSGYSFAASSCKGASRSTEVTGSDLKVTISSDNGSPAHLSLAFRK